MDLIRSAVEHPIVVELPFPAIFFGVITLAVFLVFGFVAYSYRDVYHRHEARSKKLTGNPHD